MSNLQFAYASANETALPASLAKALAPKWRVKRIAFEAMVAWTVLPDFTWLDLGSVTTAEAKHKTAIDALAGLQRKTLDPSLILISGSAPTAKEQDKFVAHIFSIFCKPANVEIDMAGEPDVRSAVAKFIALRRSASAQTRLEPEVLLESATIVAPRHPAIRIPNADLRTERGNLSIKLLADLYEIGVAELGRLIGKDKRATLIKTPDADSLQEPLRPFGDVALLRLAAPGAIRFRKWLRTPNDQMQGAAPLHWIREGRVNDVAGFVHNALTGQPA